MLGENLTQLKNFEAQLKQCLITRFGSFMPKDKISLLNNTQYVLGNEFADGMKKDSFQGNILRRMLDSIIDVTCIKEISVNGVNPSTLVYGRDLEDGLIEYYTQELHLIFNIDVDEKPELNEFVELARQLKEVYGETLDSRVFTDNASQLLDVNSLKSIIGDTDFDALQDLIELSGKVQEVYDPTQSWDDKAQKLLKIQKLKEIAKKCDENAVKKFLEKLKKTSDAKEDKDVDNRLFDEITTRSGSVQIIYLGEKKYIKYIDNDGKLHLVQAYNSDKVSDYYRDKISSLGPDEQLDPEQLFNELCEIATEEKLSPTTDMDLSTKNFDQQRMIKFVDTSEKIGEETQENVQDNQTVLHNEEGTIHAISGYNDVVHTDDRIDHVNADIISDGQNYANDNATQQNTDVGDKPLTPEEYNELCMKYANNEPLTDDELRALMMSTPELMEERQEMEEKGPTLSIGKKSSRQAAFANKSILIYIIMMVAFIGVFIGAMIFSMTN